MEEGPETGTENQFRAEWCVWIHVKVGDGLGWVVSLVVVVVYSGVFGFGFVSKFVRVVYLMVIVVCIVQWIIWIHVKVGDGVGDGFG